MSAGRANGGGTPVEGDGNRAGDAHATTAQDAAGAPPDETFYDSDAGAAAAAAALPPSLESVGDLPMPRSLDDKLPYEFPDATTLLAQMRDGHQTAAALLEQHLDRLRREQPRLNAATEVLADRAVAEAAEPRPGPLSGLPVSVKETIGLGGHFITAGSRRMPPIECARDAAAVVRLREAGAIVVARGNVPELGLSSETDNSRYGRTNNPLDVSRTCGGSSGGDAALVASGCVAAAIGSDMFGSLRIPAAFCGVVGFRAVSAAIDVRGAFPAVTGTLESWHAVGPITRTVRDARLLTDVLMGPLPLPPLLEELEFVIPDPFPLKLQQPAIASAWRRAQRVLELAGLRRVTLDFSETEGLARNLGALIATELGPGFEDMLRDEHGEAFSVLRETWRRLRGRATVHDSVYRLMRAMPLVKPRSADRIETMLEAYRNARARFADRLGPHRLLLLPTLGTLAPPHGQMDRDALKPGLNAVMTPLSLCSYLDLAAIAMPAWSDRDPRSGLPPSVTLAGVAGSEPALFAAAIALEQVLGVPGHADLAGSEPRLVSRVGRRAAN